MFRFFCGIHFENVTMKASYLHMKTDSITEVDKTFEVKRKHTKVRRHSMVWETLFFLEILLLLLVKRDSDQVSLSYLEFFWCSTITPMLPNRYPFRVTGKKWIKHGYATACGVLFQFLFTICHFFYAQRSLLPYNLQLGKEQINVNLALKCCPIRYAFKKIECSISTKIYISIAYTYSAGGIDRNLPIKKGKSLRDGELDNSKKENVWMSERKVKKKTNTDNMYMWIMEFHQFCKMERNATEVNLIKLQCMQSNWNDKIQRKINKHKKLIPFQMNQNATDFISNKNKTERKRLVFLNTEYTN